MYFKQANVLTSNCKSKYMFVYHTNYAHYNGAYINVSRNIVVCKHNYLFMHSNNICLFCKKIDALFVI